MAEPVTEGMDPESGRISLKLRPIHGSKSEFWTVLLDEDILSLSTADGRLVMMLPREEAARHLSFDWDLFHGRTVAFEVVEGMKAHRFRCGRRELLRLVRWLPLKPREEIEREARHYGVAVVVVGVVQLLFPAYFPQATGLAFVLQGLAMVCVPKRPMYAVNALLMLVVGLVLLFNPRPVAAHVKDAIDWAQVFRTGLGSMLLIWSIQQFSLLGVKYRLRVARARAIRRSPGEEAPASPVVRKVMWGVTALAALLVGQVGGLFVQMGLGRDLPMLRDWVLCLTLAALTIGMVVVLRLRPQAAYLEARVAGRFGVVLAGLYSIGVLNIDIEGNLPFPPDILWIGLFALGHPYVWIPLVLLVIGFDWWFSRAVSRELTQSGE